MYCQKPISSSVCGCADAASGGCSNELYILADRIFDSCRVKKTLKDVRLHPENLRPCRGSCCSPCGKLKFLGGASACCNVDIRDLVIEDAADPCRGGCGGNSCGNSSCGCSCCDDGLRRIRGKACIPLNLYYADENCNRFIGDACVCVDIDVLMRMPTDAQIPPAVCALGSAMFCGSCECDDDALVTLETALFLFITGRVALRINADPVTDIPACRRSSSGNGCNVVDHCLDTLPLFPSVRLGGYVLNPQPGASSALLYAPQNNVCPQAD